jgi:3-phenylpropionate/trans-cinnamate dioxygenase ferredoxin reductase subunit
MSTSETFVIVGGGMAGAKAAETLRDEGFDGRVVLLGEEDVRPYERPPLSKDLLRGEAEPDSIYVHEPGFYDERAIELRTETTATALDTSTSEVELAGGERIRYDALLLATGSRAKRIPLPGIDLDGVFLLRTVADCERLRAAIRGAGRVVVIGAGWIGSEVAASARQMGADVALIAPETVPLERVLGPEIGRIYRDVHAGHGVELALGIGVAAIEGDGKAAGVRTSGGRVLPADVVVVGAGAAPCVELAEAAGLRTDDGVVCDDRLRTSAANVFAAGDIARAEHPLLGTSIRVEHWANALEQGPAAARNMLGRDVAFDKVPYFFSDQYDTGMEYAGHNDGYDRVVFRGDPDGGEFIAFWLAGARVLAGMNFNVWDVTDDIQALIRSRADVDVDRLRDPDTPLADLLPSP